MFIDVFFFFKQKTAYEMRISDWSSDVCSSDLHAFLPQRIDELHFLEALLAEAQACRFETGAFAFARLQAEPLQPVGSTCFGDDVVGVQALGVDQRRQRTTLLRRALGAFRQIGRASCRERVCQSV